MIDLPYREIWLVDTEFCQPPGERPDVACVVARELRSGRTLRLWRDQFGPLPPYPVDENSLFVAYFASAEMCCHRVLNWPMPARILDLFTEFRDRTNGCRGIDGGFQKASLIDAMNYFGLAHIAPAEKAEMRTRFMAGNFDSWTPAEIEEGLAYCETDVVALAGLLPAMLDGLDLHRGLIRGRYSGPAVSAMQHEGVPIDQESLRFVLANWDGIIDELIARIDTAYDVYDGRHFVHKRFEEYLRRRHITCWPRTPHGLLKVDDNTFKEMSKAYPVLEPLRNLRHGLGSMRLNKLPIGNDGRNRCMLRQFGARTGRNQPSTAEFIFSPGTWLRFFIKAPPGFAVAYVDWSAAEIGIAAKLSGDHNMLADYESGDPHLAIGKANGSIPDSGDKESHSALRDRYKACNFGILYGMGIDALAGRVSDDCNDPTGFAREFMAYHRKRYSVYWEWSELNKDHASLCGFLQTMMGWHVHASRNHNARFMGNFPIQGGCADMMRIAAMLATERGVPVCCPVHDAFLICGQTDRIGTADAPGPDLLAMKDCMAEASRIALSGFELRVDAKVYPCPERYYDKRGAVMWNTINDILEAKYARKIV